MKADVNRSHQAHANDHRHAGSTPPGAIPGASSTRYTCPMHPEIVRDAPGRYPKCGMTLLPILEAIPRAAEYTCPMHPEVRSPQPGSCPKCGMALAPIAGTRGGDADESELRDLTQWLWGGVALSIPLVARDGADDRHP